MPRGTPGTPISILALAGRATSSATANVHTLLHISILALAGRATWFQTTRLLFLRHFNSRPRGEGDMGLYPWDTRKSLFQFSPSRGGRRSPWRWRSSASRYFNSRPRGEGDAERSMIEGGTAIISILALAGRATIHSEIGVGDNVFQFSPSRGGRLIGLTSHRFQLYFNSRPRGEGDETDG